MCIFEMIDHYAVNDLRAALQGPLEKIISTMQATRNGAETPIWAAIRRLRHARQNESREVIECTRECLRLVINAALRHYPIILTQPDDNYHTPVSAAILMDEFKIFQLILNYDQAWNSFCHLNYTPLEYAVQCGATNHIIWLIGHNAPYQPNQVFINQDQCIGHDGMLALILCRSLQQAPQVAQLISGLFRNNPEIENLAPEPQARRPLSGEGWVFIAQCVLPRNDQAFAALIPHLRWTVALRDCCAIAIDVGARATFEAILTVFRHAQISMSDTFELARLACLRGRIGWATELFDALTEFQNVMLPDDEDNIEPTDRLPDGTPLTPEGLIQMGVVDDLISPFWGDAPTGMEASQIHEYFIPNMEETQALANLLPLLLAGGPETPEAITRLAQIPDLDEDIANDAAADILLNIIHSNDHYDVLRQILRLPLSTALLSGNLIEAFEINNYEAAFILLLEGANPTINVDGDILEGNDLTPGLLYNLLVYHFPKLAQAQDIHNGPLVIKALLLLCYGAQTNFMLNDNSRISLVSLAQIDGQSELVQEFACLGISPCSLFESFLTNPNVRLIQSVMAAFNGIHQCWLELDGYGFYGRWLFVAAFQTNNGNHLLTCLARLANCQLIKNDDRVWIRTLYDKLIVINLNDVVPLMEQTILQADLNTIVWQNISFPWNSENSRRLAFFCEGIYRNREQITPEQRALELIRLRAMQSLLNFNVSLATINRILHDLRL